MSCQYCQSWRCLLLWLCSLLCSTLWHHHAVVLAQNNTPITTNTTTTAIPTTNASTSNASTANTSITAAPTPLLNISITSAPSSLFPAVTTLSPNNSNNSNSNNSTINHNNNSMAPSPLPSTPSPTRTVAPTRTAPPHVPTTYPSSAPSVTLMSLNQTMITIVLQGVQAHLSSRSLWAAWAGNTGDQVASFWNTYAFSPYFVDKTVTTRVYNTGRLETTVPSSSSSLSALNVSNVTIIRPLFIQYTQQLFYGLVNQDQQQPIDPLFLPTDEKIFTMPFTMNQKTYTDNLVQLLNNTVPIIVSSITIGNATSLPPPSSSVPPPSGSTITGQDRNIIIITTVITVCSLLVAGGYILYLTRKEDDDDDDDDDNHNNAERIAVDGLPFDDSFEQYHEEENAFYYGGAGARREQSLGGGEHAGYSPSGGGGGGGDPPPPGIPLNPTYTGTSSATLTSARSSGPEPTSHAPPLGSFHQGGQTSSGSQLAPSLVYGGNGSNGSHVAVTTTGSEMDGGGSSVSTGGRGRDTMRSGGVCGSGGAGSWILRDENGNSGDEPPPLSNPNNNHAYPTISTLPISVISGEGGGGGSGPSSAAYRGMRGEPGLDTDDDYDQNYSPSNEIYGNYLHHHHHHRPRLANADMQPLPTIPSMSDTREGEYDGDGPHLPYHHHHSGDEQGSRPSNDIHPHPPPPPHLMSGFQLTIEDLDDM